MKRLVEPEWLDELPPQNSGAVRSRRDLKRINRLLRHVGIISSLLRQMEVGRWATHLIDLGGGDGTFSLRLLHCLRAQCRPIKVAIVDRQDLVSATTRAAFQSLEVQFETVTADVLKWLAQPAHEIDGTIILANLFLHHFHDTELRLLLDRASARCAAFVACEPRRSALGLMASRLLGFIGCNAVTRHDAFVSVKAGFVARELSVLWPATQGWILQEQAAGIFSHAFMARLDRMVRVP